MSAIRLPAQPVDATHALNLSAGVSKGVSGILCKRGFQLTR